MVLLYIVHRVVVIRFMRCVLQKAHFVPSLNYSPSPKGVYGTHVSHVSCNKLTKLLRQQPCDLSRILHERRVRNLGSESGKEISTTHLTTPNKRTVQQNRLFQVTVPKGREKKYT